MNTLQIIYLIPWWRHKCVTSHVIKVYFIELLLNIKFIEFWRQILDQNLENVKDFLPEDWHKMSYKTSFQKKNMNIRQFSVKVANNRFDRTHCRKRLATVILKCAVFIRYCGEETQLAWSYKFCQLLCRVFISVSTGIKSIKIDQEMLEL